MPNHIISYGQIVSGINLNAEDSMTILEGGIALNTTVNEHGKLIIYSGGMAKDTTVSSNGEISVSSGGKAVNTILCNVDFLFARGNSRVVHPELVKASSASLVPVSASWSFRKKTVSPSFIPPSATATLLLRMISLSLMQST